MKKSTVQKNKSHNKPKMTSDPKLILVKNKKRKSFFPSDLQGETGAVLLQKYRNLATNVVVRLDDLLRFSDGDRLVVLDFVTNLGDCEFKLGSTTYSDLLKAVLAHFSAGMDPGMLRNAKIAASEVAALKYSDALDIACEAIKKRMQELKYTGIKTLELKKEAQSIRKALLNAVCGTGQKGVTVRSIVPDAPVSDEAIVPSKWILSETGIWVRGNENTIGLSTIVLITGISRDTLHRSELVTVTWKRDLKWDSETVDRKIIANKIAIVGLASKGLPVNSGNASVFVHYFHDYLIENQKQISVSKVSGQMGWQGKAGADGFLWGRHLVTAQWPGKNEPVEGEQITFRGADDGDDQIAGGFDSGGCFDEWLNAIELIKAYPRVKLAFYSAFVSPMLPIFESENFVLDFAGSTSQGKTTTLRVAASVWGKTKRSSRDGVVLNDWNTTQTWRERAPAIMNNFPFILDDTKTVRFENEIAQTVYTFTQGRGRGRGTLGGLAQQVGFESVMISSGERSIISFGEHGGVHARVLTLWGSPFGTTNDQTGQTVAKLNQKLSEHYGHAGPRFVAYLMKKRHRWEDYRKAHAERTEKLLKKANGNPVAGRMAAHLAAIHYTSRLVHYALDLPWEWEDPIASLYDELISEVAEADRSTAALRHAISWAVAHRNHFFHQNCSESAEPHGGWAGRWERDGGIVLPGKSSKWKYIGFMPSVLSQVLEQGGFDADPTIRQWKEKGWLKTSAGRKQLKVKLGREQTWVIAIPSEAIKAAEAK